MKNYYYLFWTDAVQRFIKHHPKEKTQVTKILTLTSWVFTLAILSTTLWLKYFHVYENKFGLLGLFKPWVDKDISPILDMAAIFLLIYVINYVLIFWRKRYLLLIKKYPMGRFNYATFIGIAMLAYFLFTIFAYGYLTRQM